MHSASSLYVFVINNALCRLHQPYTTMPSHLISMSMARTDGRCESLTNDLIRRLADAKPIQFTKCRVY